MTELAHNGSDNASAVVPVEAANAGAAKRRWLRRLPLVLKLQAAALGVAVAATLVVSVMSDAHRIERIAFAVPAQATSTTWDAERDAFAMKVSRGFGVRAATALEFSGWILEASERQSLSPELLASLVLTESSFRKEARSTIGAIGPAQVREEYWQAFCGTDDLSDPEENIYCGAQILSHYRDVCGAEVCALQSYNVGPYNLHADEYVEARARYVNKIDRFRSRLVDTAL